MTRTIASNIPAEAQSATHAGLKYVGDHIIGIRREAISDGGFRYFGTNGRPLRNKAELARIAKLVIPPAYSQVWICADAAGHIQATGRDARGRKQYRYHLRWREVRDATKYERMQSFGRALPKIRRRVARDLAKPGLEREKILATILRLLETTLIRIGNETYARDNASFGLTTLRTRHVQVGGATLRFAFPGKSGIKHASRVHDRRLARIVKRCSELPGNELFQYLDDDGKRRTIGSADVNEYLREAAGADFTAKDYRTWAGSVMALAELRDANDGLAPTKQRVVETIKLIARRLGNTPAVCRKCYVHPAVLDAYLDQRLDTTSAVKAHRGLRADEAAFLAFVDELARRARRDTRRKTGRAA